MENKYREAWKFLNNVISSTDIDRIMPLKDLIDKETPMKPIEDKHSRDILCGKCKKYIVGMYGYYRNERCGLKECGQVVDWSDDNE